MSASFGTSPPPAPNDFWRDQAAGALPDGTQDTTEGIRHAGTVHVGASATGPTNSTTHLGVVEFRGLGSFQVQTIQTTIPAGSGTMPVIRLRGNAYGDHALIDVSIGFYTYTATQIINHFWVSNGSTHPAQIRLGHVGGFVAIEVTWALAGYYYGYVVDAEAVQPNLNDAWFQNWAVSTAAMVSPTDEVVVTPGFPLLSPTTFAQAHLDGVATYSVSNELAWTGVIRYTGPGTGGDMPGGLANFLPLPVGTVVPVSGGAARTVTAAGAGHALGGITLGRYETLWGFLRSNASDVLPNEYLIQQYSAPAGVLANPPGAGKGRWFPVAFGMEASVKLADGSVITQGGRVGRHSHIQAMNDMHQQEGTQLIGYSFSPANGVFGFTGTYYVGFGTGGMLALGGSYEYINAPAVGTVAQGFGAATSKTWRAMTAAERPWEFGEVYGGTGAYDLKTDTAVLDLDVYDSLYWVPAVTGSATGYFAVRSYYDVSVVPSHWLRLATRLPWVANTRLVQWNGQGLLERQCLWAGNVDQELRTAAALKHITANGQVSCRLTPANAFAGTGADGVDGTGQTQGTYVGWPDNTMMAGMASNHLGEMNFVWLNLPPVGTEIPILNSTATRVVIDMDGTRHVGLNAWQSLVYIPAPLVGSTTAVARGWVIVDYTVPRFLPAHALFAAQMSAGGNASAAGGVNGTHVKMGDGTYVHPGLYVPDAPGAYGDQGQGTALDWRAITLAGQTPPGTGTSAIPAVAGLAAGGQTPAFRVLASGSVSQPVVMLRGAVTISSEVASGALIGFMPGQQVYDVMRVAVPCFHGTNTNVPGSAVLEFSNGTAGGSNGVLIRCYGASLANIAADNGGPHGPGGFISLDNVALQRG
jgi:hypothetical protein